MDGLMVLLTQAAATWTSGYPLQQQHGGLELLFISAMAHDGIYRLEQQLRLCVALRLDSGYCGELR